MFVRFRFFLVFACLFFLLPPTLAHADQEFLARAVPLAQKSQRESSVPASVTLAQAIWETGRGAHTIGDANNYFGIKAGDDFGPIATGSVWAWTREWDGKKYIDIRQRFRSYNSMEDSFRDHALLLATNPRYADAMHAVDDPREFARRIAAAGYATSPTYANDLIRMMDLENLYQYDLPRNAFELVGQSEPIQVNAGEIFQIYFDTKNTGFGTWSPTADYHLASANDNPFGAAERQNLDQLVAPDRVKRWALVMFAPLEQGNYITSWRFKHGGVGFGPTMSVQVRVNPPPITPLWVLIGGAALLAALLVFAIMRRVQAKPLYRTRRKKSNG